MTTTVAGALTISAPYSVAGDASRRARFLMAGAVVLPVFIAVAAALLWAAQRYREARRAEMRAVADRHGLEVDVSSKKPPPIDFDLFDRGSSRRVNCHMWRSGEPDSVIQYQFTEGSGKDSHTYEFSAALVDVAFLAPHLTISDEDLWSRMKRAVGLRDVEVESPAFNERYQVRCADERFAITLLDPPMIAWMLSPASGQGSVTFEFLGSWMLCHCSQLEIDELPGLLTWAQSVRAQLPIVLGELYGR